VDNDENIKGLIRISEGKFLVNEQAIIDGWDKYFPKTKVEPTVSKIGSALRAVSFAERERWRFRGIRIRYRVVDLDTLFAWSESSGVGSRERMEVTLKMRAAPDVEITDDVASLRAAPKQESFRDRMRGANAREPGEDDDETGY
jgi:hypothetical protein